MLGLTARVLWLSAHAVLLDEASVAVGARDIVQNHTPMWEAMSNAPFVWMIAQMLGRAGLANDFLLRLPSAITGTASITATYWLAQRMFDKKIAIGSSFLLALHPFAVAFSRVLFADPFQVFFVLIGCYGFEHLASNSWRETQKKWTLLFVLCVIWGLAFLMKYNAIVPGALWLFSGVVARRYRIVPAIAGLGAIALGAIITLLLWPYDAPVWLFAFMGKAGSYNFVFALDYYIDKLHLVFFGITEILFVAAFLIAWLLRKKRGSTDTFTVNTKVANVRASKAVLHLALFLLLQTAMLTILGRMFERYLLVLVPFGCILLVALGILVMMEFAQWTPRSWQVSFSQGTEQKLPRAKGRQILIYFAVWFAYCIFIFGAYQSYSHYFQYLRNDVNYASLAHEVLTTEQNHSADSVHRAFWLVPEPIAAYYLGYTQRYSRAVLPDRDGPTTSQNFFEFSGVPYANEWKGDKVLSIRKLAREWGMIRIVTSPQRFMVASKRVADSALRMEQLPVVDYMTSDFVRPGDMIIMQSGLTDLDGEPILEDLTNKPGPPFLPTLPLERYAVRRVYRPEGFTPITDTALYPVKAGAWLMVRK